MRDQRRPHGRPKATSCRPRLQHLLLLLLLPPLTLGLILEISVVGITQAVAVSANGASDTSEPTIRLLDEVEPDGETSGGGATTGSATATGSVIEPPNTARELLIANLSARYLAGEPISEQDELSLLNFPPSREDLGTAIPLTVIFGLLLVTGCVGNICTAIVIARPKNKYMHTATNYYLFSLAMSDFLFLILGLPQEMYTLWRKYPYAFGEPFCIIRGYLSEASTYASILTISAFTIERYVAICHPLWAHTMSQLPRAVTSIVAIWMLAAVCAIPPAAELGIIMQRSVITNKTLEQTAQCAAKRTLYENMFAVSAIVFFIVPMIIVTVLYILIALELRRSSKMNAAISKRTSGGTQASKQSGSATLCAHHARQASHIQADRPPASPSNSLGPSRWAAPHSLMASIMSQRPSSAIGNERTLVASPACEPSAKGSASTLLLGPLEAPLEDPLTLQSGREPASSIRRLLVWLLGGRPVPAKSQPAPSPEEPVVAGEPAPLPRAQAARNLIQSHQQLSLELGDSEAKPVASSQLLQSPLSYHESLIQHSGRHCQLHLPANSGDHHLRRHHQHHHQHHHYHHQHHHHHHHHHHQQQQQQQVHNQQRRAHQTATSRRPPAAGSSKKSVIRMLVAVVVSFFICWLPFHAQRLLASYLVKSQNHSQLLLDIYLKLFYASGVMYYLSSTINPLLYQLMSAKFRLAFKETFKCSLFRCALFASGTNKFQQRQAASNHNQRAGSCSSRASNSLREAQPPAPPPTSNLTAERCSCCSCQAPAMGASITPARRTSQPVEAMQLGAGVKSPNRFMGKLKSSLNSSLASLLRRPANGSQQRLASAGCPCCADLAAAERAAYMAAAHNAGQDPHAGQPLLAPAIPTNHTMLKFVKVPPGQQSQNYEQQHHLNHLNQPISLTRLSSRDEDEETGAHESGLRVITTSGALVNHQGATRGLHHPDATNTGHANRPVMALESRIEALISSSYDEQRDTSELTGSSLADSAIPGANSSSLNSSPDQVAEQDDDSSRPNATSRPQSQSNVGGGGSRRRRAQICSTSSSSTSGGGGGGANERIPSDSSQMVAARRARRRTSLQQVGSHRNTHQANARSSLNQARDGHTLNKSTDRRRKSSSSSATCNMMRGIHLSSSLSSSDRQLDKKLSLSTTTSALDCDYGSYTTTNSHLTCSSNPVLRGLSGSTGSLVEDEPGTVIDSGEHHHHHHHHQRSNQLTADLLDASETDNLIANERTIRLTSAIHPKLPIESLPKLQR